MANILVIDDSESILSFAKDALESSGHTVITTTNGMAANKHVFGTNKPDLIVLDLVMPLLDGDKVLAAFKQSSIASAIPVLLFSTKPEEEIKAIAEKHNAEGYIQKPIKADAFREIIESHLAKN